MIGLRGVLSCPLCKSRNSDIVEKTATMMGNEDNFWNFRKCKNCSLVYLSPRVSEEDLGSFYTNAYLPYRGGSAWGKYAHFVEKDQKMIDLKRVETLKEYIPKTVNRILDIGCGKPSFLMSAHEILGVKGVGLDFSDKGWRDKKKLYQSLDLNIGEINNLAKPLQADVITMWHYLEHDYNPLLTLKKLSKNQKKDTLLIIEVPNFDSYTRKKYRNFWSGYHSPRHTALYTPTTMKKLLETSGWAVVDQYTYGTLDPYTLDWMSRMERKSIDWTESMEQYFFGYVLGKILRPRYYFHKHFSLGFMTVIARNKG